MPQYCAPFLWAKPPPLLSFFGLIDILKVSKIIKKLFKSEIFMKNFKKLTLLVALGAFSVQAYTMYKAAAAITSRMMAKPALLAMGALLAQNTVKAEEGKYAPPVHIKDLITKHEDEILALDKKVNCSMVPGRFGSGKGFVSCLTVPGFCVKEIGSGRVEMANYIEEWIKEHGISTLAVPKKYKFTVGDKELVLAEAIDVKRVESINLQETKDLISFLEFTGYDDLHYGNLMRDEKTGKLFIVDTEYSAFGNDKVGPGILQLERFESKFTPEALPFYRKSLEKKKKQYEKLKKCRGYDYSISVIEKCIEKVFGR